MENGLSFVGTWIRRIGTTTRRKQTYTRERKRKKRKKEKKEREREYKRQREGQMDRRSMTHFFLPDRKSLNLDRYPINYWRP